MKVFLCVVALFCVSVPAATGQGDTLNQTDAQGRKHGFWEQRNGEGERVYRGRFEHGTPVGTFTRYYEDGSPKAIIRYGRGDKSTARIYYPETEVLMAEGNYIDQKRDSVWLFYDEQGRPASRENFRNGVKQGPSTVYYPDGSVSEKANFKDGLKQGPWQEFWPNGMLKLEATVVEGARYDGRYTTYREDGTKLKEGKYVNGQREGSWYSFNPDGSVRIIYVYRSGQVVGEYPKNGTFERYWPEDILKSKYTYKDGVRHGPYEEWYNQGEWKTEYRVDNRGNKYPVQTLHGAQLREKGEYVNGQRHGEVLHYAEDGSVERRENYINGQKQD